MTAVSESPATTTVAVRRPRSKGRIIVGWLTTTDHKVIGNLYLITSMVFFSIGGVMALVIRAELFSPGLQIVRDKEQYNQLFTMHGADHAAAVRDPAVRGLRQRDHAAADRGARRGVPAAEHARRTGSTCSAG